MQPTMTYFDVDETHPMVLSPDWIDHVPWQQVVGCPGVEEKELLRTDGGVTALIRLQPGSGTPGRPHAAAHHIWVITGEAAIGGRRMSAGSYVHVAPGVVHPVTDVGPAGCLLLQVHQP